MNKLSIKDEMTRNMIVVLAVLLITSGFIIYRVGELKMNKESFVSVNHFRETKVPAYRGNIFDSNYELLATSLPFYRASIDLGSNAIHEKVFQKNVDSLALSLSGFMGEDYDRIKKKLLNARKARSRYFKISDALSYREYLKVKSFPFLREGRFKGGFRTDGYFDRMHPFGELARRTIGFESKNGIQDVGLERIFDDVLKGKEGLRMEQRINEDLWVPGSSKNIRDPQSGLSLVTTLDINIQEILHNELEKALVNHEALRGTAVLMEVATGDIKGMASLTEVKPGKYREILNLSVQSGGDPGSTFKAASLLALLDDDKISIDDKVPSLSGEFKLYNQVIRDSHKPKTDTLHLIDAFALSSNAVISSQVHWNYSANPEAFIEKLYSFGLNKSTDVPIEDEVTPYIKHPKKNSGDWYGTSLAMMAYGYEMRLSPLQILQFYNGVANDGVLMKARLVQSIVDDELEIVSENLPEIVNKRMARPNAIRDLKRALREVTISGTASKNTLPTVCSFSGKTGTTQLNYSKRNSGETMKYSGSFVGYFPSDNPRYSLMVIISNPKKKGYYGAQIALPAFKRILNLVMSGEKEWMTPIDTIDENPLYAQLNLGTTEGAWSDFQVIANYLKDFEYYLDPSEDEDSKESYSKLVVPDVRKMGLRDALFELENRGLKVVIQGVGKVYKQSLLPGTKVNGQTIKIFLT